MPRIALFVEFGDEMYLAKSCCASKSITVLLILLLTIKGRGMQLFRELLMFFF